MAKKEPWRRGLEIYNWLYFSQHNIFLRNLENLIVEIWWTCLYHKDFLLRRREQFTRRIKIKRVIGLANENINIKEDGRVLINEDILTEEYVSNFALGNYEITLPHQLEENSVFVLGDNRSNSIDSRHFQIGDIKIDEIICEVKLVI